ncbi:MAG: transglutaminase-like domain-containing protein, partial [Candidatus Limnocylindria bacterium]
MPEWLRRYARPREGWLALALLFVMLLSLGWSIQRAEWLELLDFLVPVAFWGVLLGTVLGLTRLSVVGVLPLAAVAGTGIVLWAVGGEYFPDLSQAGRLLMLRQESLDFTRIVVDGAYAPQLTPYALGLGLLMWVTAFLAAYTMYRHHRVLDAILLVGAPLIANMASTLANLFGYLVLFTLAALLLWLRAALIGREEGWQRRRVTENVEVPAAIMRSGITFIAGSIALAWILTTVAVAAPLTAVWNNLDGVWNEVRDRLDGVFGGINNPESRIGGTVFGSSFTVRGQWFSRDDPVLTVAARSPYYLRARTLDVYTGHGFDTTPGETRRVERGQEIFPGETPERPTDLAAFEPETIEIQFQQSVGRNLFTPGFPTVVYTPAVVTLTGGQPLLGGIESANAIGEGEGYAITALISKATRAQLDAAGTAYPAEIAGRYLGIEGVTRRTIDEAVRIVTEAGAQTPYQRAEALSTYLRTSEDFRYSASAPIPDDPDADLVDFFLFDENGRIGYCEYYSVTMAVMARAVGLPSRVATGFAPGEPVELPGGLGGAYYQVRERNAHAWAEIYFPGYGWQIFESTKTIQPVIRLPGVARPSGASPGPLPSIDSRLDPGSINAFPSLDPIAGGIRPGQDEPPDDETRGGNLLLISTILLAVLGLAAWRWRRTRLTLRLLAPGERQWRRLT